jgi:hypothetical protein
MSVRYLTARTWAQFVPQLMERDLAVLKYVSDLRFVSGSQLARLCFADLGDPAACARAARRALLRLTRLGALERLPRPIGGIRAGSAGFVYRLGLGGQRLAMTRGWQPERRLRRSYEAGTLFLRHALLVAELHTRLTEGDRSRRFELLELCGEPSCWRRYDGLATQRHILKPDSYVRLGVGDFEDSYFIEVDRGTEGSRAIVAQLDRYAAYRRSGREQAERGVFPLVLWLAPDDRRAAAIEAVVASRAAAEQELFRMAVFEEALDAMVPTFGNRPDRSEHGDRSTLGIPDELCR